MLCRTSLSLRRADGMWLLKIESTGISNSCGLVGHPVWLVAVVPPYEFFYQDVMQWGNYMLPAETMFGHFATIQKKP